MDSSKSSRPAAPTFGGKNVPFNVSTSTWSPRMPQAPFGYSFQEAPEPPPPTPARGQALLNDSETNKFHDFFNQMEVGLFNDDNFPFEEVDQTSGRDTGWLYPEDLPPLFSGAVASLNYPGSQSTVLANGAGSDMFSDPFESRQSRTLSHPTSTSPTVLAAATTLMRSGPHRYQNGSQNNSSNGSYSGAVNNPAHNLPARRETIAFDQQAFVSNARNLFGPLNPYVHGSAASMRTHSRSTDQAMFGESLTLTPNNVYNGGRCDRKDFNNAGSGSHLQWGSDENFANNGFVPPPTLETVAHVTDGLLQRVQSFKAQSSATNTQPSSPVTQKPKTMVAGSIGGTNSLESLNDTNDGGDAGAPENSKTHKRRKGRLQVKFEAQEEEEAQEDWQEPKQRRGKRQKRTSTKNGRQTRADSDPNDRKTGRDNLTEEQRRENHILSEQKRRNLIKQGFEDLSELVPGLKAGGFSKSAMLTQAVEWLESLLDGNMRLQEQLAQLDGGVI